MNKVMFAAHRESTRGLSLFLHRDLIMSGADMRQLEEECYQYE